MPHRRRRSFRRIAGRAVYGHRQPMWRKTIRRIFSVGGGLVGVGIAISPTFRGLDQIVHGQVQGGVNSIVYDTTGMDPAGGHLTPDFQKVTGTVVLAAAGIAIAKLFKYLAKSI